MSLSIIIVILVLVGALLGYFFGSLMWSIIIGKIFFKKDPRDFNSKNAGATNSSRIYGKKIGLLILILDILKGFLPTIIMWLIAKYAININRDNITTNFNPYSLCFVAGLFGIIGHCFPMFFKFNGGKGVATFGAFLISIMPFAALWQLLIMIAIVYFFHYVSLASLLCSMMSWIWFLVPGLNYSFILDSNINNLLIIDGYGALWLLFILALVFLATILIWIKHYQNINNLILKKERKFFFKTNKK